MNSFEQIQLEEETKEVIKGYRKKHNQHDLDRLDEIARKFGAKNPAEIDMWRTVWDDFNMDYEAGIPESHLPEAIKGALGLTDTEAVDAVNIGKEFDLLIEGTPANSVELEHADPDETILRLVGPKERPDLYCEEVEEYADRNKWSQIWDSLGVDPNTGLTEGMLINSMEHIFNVETQPKGKAIIEVGVMANCIIEEENEYTLSSERPEDYWLEIWDNCTDQLEETLPQNKIKIGIASKEGINVDEASDILDDAIDRGEIYSPEDAPDEQFAINDPATDDGPEIDKRLGGQKTTDDDNPDGGSADPATNGASSPATTTETESPASADTQDHNSAAHQSNAETTGTQAATNSAEATQDADTQTADADADHTQSASQSGTDGDQTAQTSPTDSETAHGSDTTADATDPTTEGSTETPPPSNTQSPVSATVSTAPPAPDKTKEELIEQEGLKPLRAAVRADPPETDRIEAAMAAAIEFCHDQLDEEIPENIAWNENNPNAPYRKPETPREYFQDPQYDTDPANAYLYTNKPEYIPPKSTDEDPDADANDADTPDGDGDAEISATLDGDIPEGVEEQLPERISQQIDDDVDSHLDENTAQGRREFEISQTANNIILANSRTMGDERANGDDDNDDAPATDSEGKDAANTDTETIIHYNYRTRDNRGWSPETIEAKQLGWAPRDTDSLRDFLLARDFTKKELVATGLFNITDDGTLLPHIQARYVFPYFDETGKPVFLISRSFDTDIPGGDNNEGPDYHSESKYLKPKDSRLPEPIYGTQTIQPGEPLVITEGIADAITAHAHDIPCISPVTKKFKDKHYTLLEKLIVKNDIPRVYIIQDADPPSGVVKEKYTAAYADQYDPNRDGKEPVEADSLSDAMKVAQKGPGFRGALETAQYLDAVARREASQSGTTAAESEASDEDDLPDSKWTPADSEPTAGREIADNGSVVYHPDELTSEPAGTPDRAFETYLIELPRFGGVKYDLDDYLSDGMAQIAPPAQWVAEITDMIVRTPRWIANLNLEGHLNFTAPEEYADQPAVGELGVTGVDGKPIPPRATTLNYLPTVGPNNTVLAPAINTETGITPDIDDLPSLDDSSSSSNELFNLTHWNVLGLDVGFRGKSPAGHYGDSEDYFCVLNEKVAYCHKRKVSYTPSTIALVLKGERTASNPEGSLSPKEKFVFWEYAIENNLLTTKPPREALIHYAKREGIATDDDLITRDGPYGEFETLPVNLKSTVFDRLDETYGLDLERGWVDSDTKSDSNETVGSGQASQSDGTSTANESGSSEQSPTHSGGDQSGNSSSQSASGTSSGTASDTTADSGQSPTPAESGSASEDTQTELTGEGHTTTDATEQSTADAAGHSTGEEPSATTTTADGRPDDEELSNPGNIEGGNDTQELFERLAAEDDTGEIDPDIPTGESEEDDESTRFQTYEEPDLDTPGIDVDTNAVGQFVDDFCIVDPQTDERAIIPKDDLINIFTEWCVINEVRLDELSVEKSTSERKGNLKKILEKNYNITDRRPSVDGERVKAFDGIILSELGKELSNEL